MLWVILLLTGKQQILAVISDKRIYLRLVSEKQFREAGLCGVPDVTEYLVDDKDVAVLVCSDGKRYSA